MSEERTWHAQIDRLAAGELNTTGQRELFTWLDGEPGGWRRCALALLETRELEQAFADWRPKSITNPVAPLRRATPAPTIRWGAITAMAASLLVAFSSGVFIGGRSFPQTPMIAKSVQSKEDKAATTETGQRPSTVADKASDRRSERLVAAASVSASSPPTDILPPYVRSQLERRGYQATSRHARLPVVLPDGRRVVVPVDGLQLNYVGQRTY